VRPTARPAPEAGAVSGPLAIVTTTCDEAACWRSHPSKPSPLVHASGADGGRALAGAVRLIERHVSGFVSFGGATALAPALRPGDLVIGEAVVLPSGETIRTADTWRDELVRRAALLQVRVMVARVAGDDATLLAPREKSAAFRSTAAATLDTESHVVAEVARRHHLPFLAVRVVVDGAQDWPPPACIAALGADGSRRTMALAMQAGLRLWDLPATWRHLRHQKLALEVLRRAAALTPAPGAIQPRLRVA
jgi:hypothetical protein